MKSIMVVDEVTISSVIQTKVDLATETLIIITKEDGGGGGGGSGGSDEPASDSDSYDFYLKNIREQYQEIIKKGFLGTFTEYLVLRDYL